MKFLLPIFISGTLFSQIADRVVVEINSLAYSQRHVELFISVFDAISNEIPQPVRAINANNWNNVLSQFENFMLVEQEAHRLGSYLPSNKMIQKGLEVYRDKLSKDEILQKNTSRLKANESSIKKAIISVLRVAAFLRSKAGRDASQLSGSASPKDFSDTSWFKTLKRRAIIRYMEEGRHFKTIRSF